MYKIVFVVIQTKMTLYRSSVSRPTVLVKSEIKSRNHMNHVRLRQSSGASTENVSIMELMNILVMMNSLEVFSFWDN